MLASQVFKVAPNDVIIQMLYNAHTYLFSKFFPFLHILKCSPPLSYLLLSITSFLFFPCPLSHFSFPFLNSPLPSLPSVRPRARTEYCRRWADLPCRPSWRSLPPCLPGPGYGLKKDKICMAPVVLVTICPIHKSQCTLYIKITITRSDSGGSEHFWPVPPCRFGLA